MIRELERLKDKEAELVFKAPFLVCILIAGADGTIDRREIKEAISVARKSVKKEESMTNYFTELFQDFEDKLKMLIQEYPYEVTQRNPLLVDELSELNDLFPKLDKKFAVQFYNTLLSLAENVASSSGGVLGIRSVGQEESKFVKLNMITDPSKA